jgi:FRG domain-containing protein/SET domain-containing protein
LHMSLQPKTATSVKEFFDIVSNLSEKWDLWFRGQANVEWGLVPRLYRRQENGSDAKGKKARRGEEKESREDDDESRERFITRAASLSDIRPTDKWDWYYVMQHYGAATRLLDWTEGALIGLYFAVRENRSYHDAAVWALDPWELNRQRKAVGTKEVIPPGDPGITKQDRRRYDKWLWDRFAKGKKWAQLPAAVYPGHIMRRIGAQRSCFTIHGWDRRGLDVIAEELNVPLTKIVIRSWAVGSIREELEICGIDETTVFPDLEGLSKSLLGNSPEPPPPHRGVFTRLRPSKIARGGVGVFAIRRIRKGTNLFQGDNDEMIWVEDRKVPKVPPSVRKLYDDFAVIRTDDKKGKPRYGCPTNFNRLTVAWYLNDSTKPNVRCDEYYNFFALRDIEPGEELTADYSTYSEKPPAGL